MAVWTDMHPVSHHPFMFEFQIKKFTESPISVPEHPLGTGRDRTVYLSVQGKGALPENKDFVVFCIGNNLTKLNYIEREVPAILICSCSVHILDVEGSKKIPRTFTFENDSKYSYVYQERYTERTFILNNASEYLQEDTLTITVEGTVEEWNKYRWPLLYEWEPIRYCEHFLVEEIKHDRKIYLPFNSLHAGFLLRHSEIFRSMMDAPVEGKFKSRILIRNEELPAFLSMLFFIETRQLILYNITIIDLYKIAHLYDVQVLLEECRKYIAKYIPRNARTVLEFATYYNDRELKRTTESYIESHSHETRESNDSLERGNELGDFNWDSLPVSSNSINTEADFQMHVGYLMLRCISEVTPDFFNPISVSETGTNRESFDFYQ